MEEKYTENEIKIYVRGEKKVYINVEENIFFYEDQDFYSIMEKFKEEHEIEGKSKVSLILHFSHLVFKDEVKLKGRSDFISKYIFFRKEKYYLNHIENNYINIYMEKRKISNLLKSLRKLEFEISNIKVDFDLIYNYYKAQDMEILQLGEEESLRFLIQNEKIKEVEKISMMLSDVDKDIENYDFGEMKGVFCNEEDLKIIFSDEYFDTGADFFYRKRENSLKELKNIRPLEVGIVAVIIVLCFYAASRIPLKKIIEENETLRLEIKKREEDYLKSKKDKMPDYSEELSKLTEIDKGIKRREYYSVIKFLVDNSELGVDYIKLNYENRKWTVNGEISDFRSFEKFEGNMEKRYKDIELGYIKDNDNGTVFEYIINE